MAKCLRKQDVAAINEIVQDCLSYLDENKVNYHNAVYQELLKAYNRFEAKSNTVATMEIVREAVRELDNAFGTTFGNWVEGIIFDGVRSLNYPSHWTRSHKANARTYMLENPGPGIATATDMKVSWICPGAGGRESHQHPFGAYTIEHVIPVVDHWNEYGYDQTKQQRKQWYHDFDNLILLCGPCNSAKGGGGSYYRIDTGPNYSN